MRERKRGRGRKITNASGVNFTSATAGGVHGVHLKHSLKNTVQQDFGVGHRELQMEKCLPLRNTT